MSLIPVGHAHARWHTHAPSKKRRVTQVLLFPQVSGLGGHHRLFPSLFTTKPQTSTYPPPHPFMHSTYAEQVRQQARQVKRQKHPGSNADIPQAKNNTKLRGPLPDTLESTNIRIGQQGGGGRVKCTHPFPPPTPHAQHACRTEKADQTHSRPSRYKRRGSYCSDKEHQSTHIPPLSHTSLASFLFLTLSRARMYGFGTTQRGQNKKSFAITEAH